MDHGSGWRRSGTKLLVSISALFITSELNWVYCLWVGQGPFTSSKQKRTWKQKSKETFCFPMTCFLFVRMYPSHLEQKAQFFLTFANFNADFTWMRTACPLIFNFSAVGDISYGSNPKRKKKKKNETSCWKYCSCRKSCHTKSIKSYKLNLNVG